MGLIRHAFLYLFHLLNSLYRSEILVTFFLKLKVFKMLPPSLQNGDLIKLQPVLFLMGINEQATLAEK